MSDRLTMTADEIPSMLEDSDFKALPYTQQRELTDRALSEAGQQVAQDWTPETYKTWGKFVDKARSTVDARDSSLNAAGRWIGDKASGAADMGMGLLKDAGTVAVAAGEALHPAGWRAGLPVLRAAGNAFAADTNQVLANTKQFVAPAGGQGSSDQNAVQSKLDTLKKQLDAGDFPMEDKAKFAEWMGNHDAELATPRAQWFATVNAGGSPGAKPSIAEDSHAWANGLGRPDNAALVSAYMVNRDPAVWKQLQDNLLETPDVAAARGEVKDVRTTPGAKLFEQAFGPGSADHLIGAANPLTLAGFALPAIRGAAAVGDVTGAMSARQAAGAIGNQMLHGAPEMAGFGAASAVDANPNATAGDLAKGAVNMATSGALLSGAIGAVGYGVKRALNNATAPDVTAPSAATGDAATSPPPPAEPAAGSSADQTPSGASAQANPDFTNVNDANDAKPGSSASSSAARNAPADATDKTVGEAQDVAGSTPAVGAPLPLRDSVRAVLQDKAPDHPLRLQASELMGDVQTGAITPAVAMERLQLKDALTPDPAPEPPPSTTVIEDQQLYPTREIPVKDIHLSEDVPNFKEGSRTDTGVVEGDQLSGKYERLGTGPIVLWERLNGRKEVITGRHRLDLARRAGEKTIPSQIVKEADGFTKEDAFTFDAESNIKDGQGTVADYAHYFKHSKTTAEEAASRGLLARDKGRKGFALGKAASDDLYSLYRAGKVGEQTAASIATEAPGDAGAQSVGIRAALSGASGPDAVNAMKAAKAGRQATQTQGDFFTDTSLDEQWREQGKRATQMQKELRDQIAAVSGAAKRPETAAKLGVDVKDPEGINKKLVELKTTLARWENWPSHPDLVEVITGRKPSAPAMEAHASSASSDMGDSLFDMGGTESTRPMNRGETATAQNADPLAEMFGAKQASETARAQGSFGDELSRQQTEAYRETAFERAQRGDESAFDDMEAAFRERHGYGDPASAADELSRQGPVFTASGFERMFEDAFKAKDFDTILEAMKQSDRGVYTPLLKRFFKEQGDNPESAVKAEWMRHVFAGTRPMDAAPPRASAPPPQQRNPGTSQPPPRASAPPPRQSTPPRASTPPPPKAPPIPPRIPVAPITGRMAKSPFRIIEDFAKDIGKALRVRSLKPSQLGVYRPGSTMTGIRFAGDLDTAAHELAGHWTDDKHGLGRPWMNSPTSPYDGELAGFWAHGSPSKDIKIQRAEGIAEFIRAYVMDPQTTIKQAPKFAAYFEKTLPKEALTALNKFSDDVRTWAGEQPLRRAALNIRMDPPTLRERLATAFYGDRREFKKTLVDKWRSWFDDQYHYALKGFETALRMQGKSMRDLKPSENFDMQLHLLSSHDARLSDQLDNGLIPLKPTQTTNAKGELEVQRTVDPVTKQPMSLHWLLDAFDNTSKDAQERDMREASAMMVAERTLEKARIIDDKAAQEIAAISPNAANAAKQRLAILADAEKQKRNLSGLGAGMMTDVDAARSALVDLNRDPNKAKRLKEAARRYRAWTDANIDYLVDAGRMSPEQAKTIRAENAQYVDMHRVSEEFDLASREARGVGTLGTSKDVVKRFKGSALEIENVYKSLLAQTDTIQKEAIRNRVMQTFVNQLESTRKLYEGDPVELDQIGSRASLEDRNTVRVYRNGQAEFWKLDKDIHEAVKGMGDLGSHVLVDILSAPQSVARYLITHAPPFAVRNAIRDTVERSVVSESGGTPWDILKGYTKADKSRLNAFGGGMFGNYAKDRLTWNRELKRGMTELRKDPRNILLTPLQLKHSYEKIMESSETLGRVAEFRRAYDKGIKQLGYSPDEAALFAASEARGLLDFAKMGSVMRTINRIVPFSNAHLRGMAKSISTGMKNPAGFALRWGMYVLAPTLLMRMWNRNQSPETEAEYQQMPAWQRDFFWNFKVGGMWLRIPKPHELGVMAGGVERAVSSMLGEKHAGDGYGGSVASAMLPISSPVEATGPMKVPLELIFNRSTFQNRDIIPPWERDLKLELRKGAAHASGTGKAIGNLIGADPRYVDHFLNSFGGLGQAFTDFTMPERRLGDTVVKQTGLSAQLIGTQSVDYQWVMDWARTNGKMSKPEIKHLHNLVEPIFKAKTMEDADKAARTLRERATTLRDAISARQP